MSTNEDERIQSKLGGRYQIVYSAGAGYKLLCVADRRIGSYLLSKSSTFKWDTCAPHAILLSLGGGIVDFKKTFDIVERNRHLPDTDLCSLLNDEQLLYNKPDERAVGADQWSNAGGLIAYVDVSVIVDILKALL